MFWILIDDASGTGEERLCSDEFFTTTVSYPSLVMEFDGVSPKLTNQTNDQQSIKFPGNYVTKEEKDESINRKISFGRKNVSCLAKDDAHKIELRHHNANQDFPSPFTCHHHQK